MADDDRNRGYRDNDAYRRPRPQPAQPADDPLAELARLIGQQNEAAPSYRQNGAHAPYGQDAADQWPTQDPYAARDGYRQDVSGSQSPSSLSDGAYPDGYQSQPGAYADSQFDSRYHAAAQQHGDPGYDSGYGAEGDPREHQYQDPRYADPRYAEPHHQDIRHTDPRHTDPRHTDPRHTDPRHTDPRHADPRHADPRYADPRYAEPRYDDDPRYADSGYPNASYTDSAYSDPRYANSHYPEPNFGAAQSYGVQPQVPESQAYAPQTGDSQGYAAYGYQDGAQPRGNSHYGAVPAAVKPVVADDHGPAKRRGSIVTVLAVLALAVVGTAAAFGYRAMFGGGGTPVPPPVIKADVRPNKVIPATPSDPNAKPIQDRVGVKTEKIVPREEQPVQATAPGQPRQIAPWLPAQTPQTPASSNALQGGSPSASGEPKRIRTVPIRPDQGGEAPAPRSQSRSAAPALAAQADGSGPLALSPSAPPQAQPQRQAARSIPATAAATPPATTALASTGSPFPTPVSSGPPQTVTGSAVAGAYAVQVTSQRSEADAQSSYRSLQQQFPSVLGSRQPVIRRADLGEKGTYYRAQIPFSNQGEANEFCSSLKAAGGQCVVQRN